MIIEIVIAQFIKMIMIFIEAFAIVGISLLLMIVMDQIFNIQKTFFPPKKPTIISIEGNIGVGKSTLIKLLKERLDSSCDFVCEPTDLWNTIVDENGDNLLNLYYTDKKRWAYVFQNMAYITRMNMIAEAMKKSTKQFIILDRSLTADKKIFAEMLHDTDFIGKLEWTCYCYLDEFFEKAFNQDKHNVIYLDCDAQTSFNRIQLRGREEEKGITLDFLTQVKNYHDKWLQNPDSNYSILTIDCNEDFVNDQQRFENVFDRISTFMNTEI